MPKYKLIRVTDRKRIKHIKMSIPTFIHSQKPLFENVSEFTTNILINKKIMSYYHVAILFTLGCLLHFSWGIFMGT